MNLVERYVYAVVRRLPAKSRDDIEKELRSLIMDALDEKGQGREATEQEIIEVLEELGSPAKMAANYYGNGSSIIGPRFFDLYMLVLKIALAAALVGITIAFVIGAAARGVVYQDVGKLIGSLVDAFLSTVGAVTIGFAITERVNAGSEPTLEKLESDWSPKDLPEVPTRFEKIKPSKMVVGLLFTVIFFILLNFYPEFLGVVRFGTQDYVSAVNMEILRHYLPIINTLFALAFLKLILLLAEGKYNWYTFALEILGSLGVVLLAVMLMNGPSLIVGNLPGHAANESITKILNSIFRGVLAVMIIVGIFDVGRYAFRLFRSRVKSI
ncbi:MAG: hypothetical protein N2376_14650 [Clostridia bacterium]|nr:hypothetical protein [Clostridia bacterium]